MKKIELLPYVFLRIPSLQIENIIGEKIDNLDLIHKYESLLIQHFKQDDLIFLSKKDILPILRKKINSLKNEEEKTSLLNTLTLYENSLTNFNKDFEFRLTKHSNNLLSNVKNNILLNGIIYSSDNLRENIDKYLLKNEANKKTRQTLLGLLQYYARGASKTSPFNSFTNIAYGKINYIPDNLDELIVGYQKNDKPILVKNINIFLIKYIINFIENNIAYFRKAELKINATMEVENGYYKFVLNKNNKESFQTIKSFPALDFIFKLFIDEKISVEKILNLLYIELDTTDKKESLNFIIKLITSGFLVLHIPFNVFYENRMSCLIEYVESIADENNKIDVVIEPLQKLNKLMKNKTISTNIQIEENEITLAVNNLKKYFSAFTKNNIAENRDFLFPFKKTNVIYCDYTENDVFEINKNKLSPIINTLNLYLDRLIIFDRNLKEYKNLSFIFDSYNLYDISVVEFYHLYWKFLKKDDNFKSLSSSFDKEEDLMIKKIQENLQSIFKNDEEKISIPLRVFDHFDHSNISLANKKSYTCYLQNLENNKYYVDAISSGYGRAFGRFLHLFNDEISKEINAYNNKFFGDDILVENNDANFFTGNLHGKITDYELEFNNINHFFEDTQKINLKDVYVKKDTDNLIFLYHKLTGKKIFPVNLSLQSSNQRSKLFQFMDLFSPNQAVAFSYLIKSCNCFHKKINKNIVLFPEIYIENNILIRRRFWEINTRQIKEICKIKDESFLFLSLNQWFLENNIDNFGYVNSPANEKYKKPQFFDLRNPIFIGLFKKIVLNSEYIYISKMQPSYEEFLNFNTGKRNVEFMLTWYASN